MNRKTVNIIIILALAVVVIFMGLGFLGLGGLGFNTLSNTPASGAEAILEEVRTTGTVAELRTEDIVEGTGEPAKVGDTLSVRYIGILPDGTVFDSTDMHGGQLFTFTVGSGSVIAGWDQGLIGMKEGGRRLLAVPPSLGYGAQAYGPIPANSTLIFEVELVERVPGTATSSNP